MAEQDTTTTDTTAAALAAAKETLDNPAGDLYPNDKGVDTTSVEEVIEETADDAPKSKTTLLSDGDEKAEDDKAEDDKTENDKTENDKAEEIDPDAVPEDGNYQLSMPEGVELDTSMLDVAKPLLVRAGATNAEVQKIADHIAEQNARTVESMAEANAEAFSKTVSDWEDQSRADKEFGGDAFKENLAKANKALTTYGTKEAREALDKSGLGSHPEIIRMLVNVGNGITDDDVPSSEVTGSVKASNDLAEIAGELYGGTTPSTRKA